MIRKYCLAALSRTGATLRRLRADVICTLAVAAACSVFLCGCGLYPAGTRFVITTGLDENILFYMGDITCTTAEFRVYLQDMRSRYEDKYGAEIWKVDTGRTDMPRRVKNACLTRITRIKLMGMMAKSRGIELDGEELERARTEGDEFYNSMTPEQLSLMGEPDAEVIRGIFVDNAIADKLYEAVVSGVNPEVSDDEARRVTVEKLTVSDRSLAQELLVELAEGRSFEELMATYGGGTDGTFSFGKGEMDSAVEDAVFRLAQGEFSGIVETEEGFTLYKCMNTLNREETENNKLRIREERRNREFEERFREFSKDRYRIMNEEVWESL